MDFSIENEKSLLLKDILTLPEQEIKEIDHITTKQKETTKERIKLIKKGQCIIDIPNNSPYKTKAKFNNSYKRLDYDNVYPTLTNIAKTIILHPEFNRILTVREGMRIQSFEDSYKLSESASVQDKYLFVANAIPPKLTEFVGNKVAILLDELDI